MKVLFCFVFLTREPCCGTNQPPSLASHGDFKPQFLTAGGGRRATSSCHEVVRLFVFVYFFLVVFAENLVVGSLEVSCIFGKTRSGFLIESVSFFSSPFFARGTLTELFAFGGKPLPVSVPELHMK